MDYKKKEKLLTLACVAIFGLLGIYFTFIFSNTSRYDSQTRAYDMYIDSYSDSDGDTMYSPIYYFRVKGVEYQCKSIASSSAVPSEDKNMVYYNSEDPNICIIEYDKSTNRSWGIIFLLVAILIGTVYVVNQRKKETDYSPTNPSPEIDWEKKQKIEENKQKVIEVAYKVELIVKRVILGIIIGIVLIFTLIDTSIFKQTIVSKNYPEAIATYSHIITEEEAIFDDCVYTFTDNKGQTQEIIVSVSKHETPKETIKIKYNENNPEDYYDDGSTLDKTEMVWYIVKIVALIGLIFLFCNRKLLDKIHLRIG